MKVLMMTGVLNKLNIMAEIMELKYWKSETKKMNIMVRILERWRMIRCKPD